MRVWSTAIVVVVTICASAGVSSAETQSNSVEENRAAEAARRADALFDSGARAFEEGEYAEALEHLESAHRIHPTYRTAAVLGQVELHLGSFRDAAEHLDYSLRSLPAASESGTRQRVMVGLNEARRHVHIVTIQSDVRGAEVLVDDQLVASTPIGHDLFLEPGTRRIVVQKAQYTPFAVAAFMPAGGQQRLSAELQPILAAPTLATEEEAEPAGTRLPDSLWPRAVLIMGGTATAIAAGVGASLQLSVANIDSKAEQWRKRLAPDTCSNSSGNWGCARLTELVSRQERYQTYASVAFAGAALGLVGTLGLHWWLTRESDSGSASLPMRVGVAANAVTGEPRFQLSGVF